MSKISYLLLFVFFLLSSCSSDDKESLSASEQNVNMSMEGGTVNLEISSDVSWQADHTANWFRMSSYESPCSRIIRLTVDPNIGGDREGTIVVRTAKSEQKIRVFQLGGKPGAEIVYELPVIFHILYNDPSDPKQNIPYDYVVKALETANALYRNAGEGSPDFRVKFVLAEKDPQGVVLEEPGVVRERWFEAKTDAPDFMNRTSKDYLSMCWDPNRYVNVMLYNFTMPQLLGISTFPLVPKEHPWPHLDASPKPVLTVADLDKVRCVSINSIYMDQQKSVQHKNVSNDVGHTLAHELGHYLGLRHTFSEKSSLVVPCQDTDDCLDTPSYDREEYNHKVDYIFKKLETDPEFRSSFDSNSLFYRDECDGTHYLCRNIMDYDFCTSDYFSPDQYKIVRHVLRYSPFIPGPKIVDGQATRAEMARKVTLPNTTSDCPESLTLKYGDRLTHLLNHRKSNN